MPKGIYPRPVKLSVKRHLVTQPLNTSYRLIPLTQRQNAIVDVGDFQFLSNWNWQACWSRHTQSFYAVARYGLRMHSLILGGQSDHKNHDTLDNRKNNLRRCTYAQNACNRRRMRNNKSGFNGVHWNKDCRKWRASIRVKTKLLDLGVHRKLEDAARAYDAAAKQYFGEFACLNFPNQNATRQSL